MILRDSPSPFGMPDLGTICWDLWKQRYHRIFEDKYRSHGELVIFIFKFLLNWMFVWADFDEMKWYSI